MNVQTLRLVAVLALLAVCAQLAGHDGYAILATAIVALHESDEPQVFE